MKTEGTRCIGSSFLYGAATPEESDEVDDIERHITLPSRRMPFKGRRRVPVAAAASDAAAAFVNSLQRGETSRIFGARRNPEADGAGSGGGDGDGDDGDRRGGRQELLTIRWPQLDPHASQKPE